MRQASPISPRALGKILPPASPAQQHDYFLQGVQTQVQTAGVLGIIAVRDKRDKRDKRDNGERLREDRLWQRMHLWATTNGLAMNRSAVSSGRFR